MGELLDSTFGERPRASRIVTPEGQANPPITPAIYHRPHGPAIENRLSNEATFPVKETRPNGDASDRGKVRVEMAGLESVKPGELEAGQMALEPVREVIETTRSKALERGFEIGVYNRHGVTVRNPTDGGDQERQLAQRSPVAPTSH